MAYNLHHFGSMKRTIQQESCFPLIELTIVAALLGILSVIV